MSDHKLLEEIYEWMKKLDTEDGKDHIGGYIDLMPKVEEALHGKSN